MGLGARPNLAPLRREHEQILRLAAELRLCADSESGWLRAHNSRLRTALRYCWWNGVAPHLAAEERGFPFRSLRPEWEGILNRSHQRIEELAEELLASAAPEPRGLHTFAAYLQETVLWEEAWVFPRIEELGGWAMPAMHPGGEPGILERCTLPLPTEA